MSDPKPLQFGADGSPASIAAASADAANIETRQTAPPTEPVLSDVLPGSSVTGVAPSFPSPTPVASPTPPPATPPLSPPQPGQRPTALLPGAQIDDFQVVRLLGRGAFGHVYLARQVSLDRLVALKISANRGSEGRTMARLEHQHIVQVFSETIDAASNQRLLCMQLVTGVGLEKLILALHTRSAAQDAEAPREWDGQMLLEIIDRNVTTQPILDPSAFRDREALARMDAAESTAWFGGRLAEALDFAHRNGVLHRDIKPANILVNSYGQPMLADFNISSYSTGAEHADDEMFGGTFAYMAPEHLDAFNPEDDTKVDAVTAQSDIYSLAIVLHQMLAGSMPFALPEGRPPLPQLLRQIADGRRAARPVCREGTPNAQKTLERTISRCLEPSPTDRFARGTDLADQLDGCRRLREVELHLPPPLKPLAGALRKPFRWLIILITLPQLVATAVNFTYNFSHYGRDAIYDDWKVVVKTAIAYNLIVYPISIGLQIWAARPVWKCWRALEGIGRASDEEVAQARQQALRLPIWFAAITAVGWYAGGLVFPLIVKIFNPETYVAHFMLAHLVSGLIALAYSLCGALFIVLRVLYPAMWQDTGTFTASARKELVTARFLLGLAQYLAGAIPLVGAVFLLVMGNASDTKFRIFTTVLISLGLVGFYTASTAIRRMSQIVEIMTSRPLKSKKEL
jgi:eukaryotic-like serine/threonine-protein kinase